MRAFALGLALWGALAPSLRAEPKLALFGPFPQDKSVETEAGQKAVDAYNASQQGPRLKLAVVNSGLGEEAVAASAKRLALDPEIVAVVVYGEAGVEPAALDAFKAAHLAVVAATSWASPRPAEVYTTWLCPALNDLAETAAHYARREARTQQVAVVDDGSDTSVAAAKAFVGRYRSLGGKVPFQTTWRGDAEDLSVTVKGLATHWPQMVFYTGGAETAGRLVLAMKGDRALKNADLIGLPPLFEPEFFNTTGLKGMRTRALFPCPDYDGMGSMVRDLGFTFGRTSPEWRAYYQFANRHPGRWTSMLFDGVALAAKAVRAAALAAAPGPSAQTSPATAASLTVTVAQAGTASASVSLSPTASDHDATPTAAVVSREEVRLALLAIDGYKGIRGAVKFSATREPQEPRAMVYFAMNRVNRKDMLWKQKAYGPPF